MFVLLSENAPSLQIQETCSSESQGFDDAESDSHRAAKNSACGELSRGGV
jgi:hypothetical protein